MTLRDTGRASMNTRSLPEGPGAWTPLDAARLWHIFEEPDRNGVGWQAGPRQADHSARP